MSLINLVKTLAYFILFSTSLKLKDKLKLIYLSKKISCLSVFLFVFFPS